MNRLEHLFGILTVRATPYSRPRDGPLRPKSPSPALLLEVLDRDGDPAWMARDAAELAAIARCMGSVYNLMLLGVLHETTE